ncbi:hypothetical protein BMS3Abin15_01180 [bacterium BMS3Abin15]|nr:hypothetical protein BMS3Abin15_01180 [bacterium BMS3Abin15]
MGFFSKLFGNQKSSQISEDIETHNKIVDFAKTLAENAFVSGETLKPHFIPNSKEDELTIPIDVCFEFLYFYSHLAMRYAHSILGQKKRTILQKKLGPLIVEPIVTAYFDHWPEDKKRGIEIDFYKNLNDAELEYSSCKELLTKDINFEGTSLLSKLGITVADVSGNPMNHDVIMVVIDTAMQSIKKMKLEDSIKSFKDVL